MVDTRKLENISDAKSWLKGISEDLYIESNGVYIYSGEEYIMKILQYWIITRKFKRDMQT